jgi:hypothetical protein
LDKCNLKCKSGRNSEVFIDKIFEIGDLNESSYSEWTLFISFHDSPTSALRMFVPGV